MSSDASGSLPHTLQSEVSVLPPVRDCWVNTDAIVTHTQGKIMRISELYFQLTCPRMHTCVANGFVADAVNFIADNGMNLSGIANHSKCDRHGIWDEIVLGRALESLSEVVCLRRCGAQ